MCEIRCTYTKVGCLEKEFAALRVLRIANLRLCAPSLSLFSIFRRYVYKEKRIKLFRDIITMEKEKREREREI